jgi:hypothetical protein
MHIETVSLAIVRHYQQHQHHRRPVVRSRRDESPEDQSSSASTSAAAVLQAPAALPQHSHHQRIRRTGNTDMPSERRTLHKRGPIVASGAPPAIDWMSIHR